MLNICGLVVVIQWLRLILASLLWPHFPNQCLDLGLRALVAGSRCNQSGAGQTKSSLGVKFGSYSRLFVYVEVQKKLFVCLNVFFFFCLKTFLGQRSMI